MGDAAVRAHSESGCDVHSLPGNDSARWRRMYVSFRIRADDYQLGHLRVIRKLRSVAADSLHASPLNIGMTGRSDAVLAMRSDYGPDGRTGIPRRRLMPSSSTGVKFGLLNDKGDRSDPREAANGALSFEFGHHYSAASVCEDICRGAAHIKDSIEH